MIYHTPPKFSVRELKHLLTDNEFKFIKILFIVNVNNFESFCYSLLIIYHADIPDILCIARNSSEINLITTRFVGVHSNSDPILLSTYDNEKKIFLNENENLFPNKMKNLEGRPLQISFVNYIPYTNWEARVS